MLTNKSPNESPNEFQYKNQMIMGGAVDENQTLKSINGRRCLSKCYPKGETFLHPVLLTGLADKIHNSCAIDPVHAKNTDFYMENDMIYTDACKVEDNDKYLQPNELESILLSFYFNPLDFLINIYDINSFDQIIYWTLNNDNLPFNTIKRVHNCGWKVFGSNFKDLSNTVLEYYYDICKTYWIKDYVQILDHDYSITMIADKPIDIDKIIQQYLPYNIFVSQVKKYIKDNEKNWSNNNHYEGIKKTIFDYVLSKLNK